MGEIGKIVVYAVAILAGGAALAPPFFWLGQWAISADIVPALSRFGFSTYFNRAALVLALVLLWPWLRWLGLRRWSDLQLEANPHRARHLLVGSAFAALSLAAVAALLVRSHHLLWRGMPTVSQVGSALLSGIAVAFVEELLFRGALFAALRRRLPWPQALLILTILFAVIHFIKPDPAIGPMGSADWLTGYRFLPHLVWQLQHWNTVVGSGVTLLLMGGVLGFTVVKTRSLYLAIGLHAGWVFVLKLVTVSTISLPSVWMGGDLRSGLAPALLMLGTWGAAIWGLGPSWHNSQRNYVSGF